MSDIKSLYGNPIVDTAARQSIERTNGRIGDLSELDTTAKTDLVSAINEISGKASSSETRLDMVVTMQEVQQEVEGQTGIQLVDPSQITWSPVATKYRGVVPKIAIPGDGKYYSNPIPMTSNSNVQQNVLYNVSFYDAFGEKITLTKDSDGSTLTSLSAVSNTYNSWFEISGNKLKTYVRGSTMNGSYTLSGEVASIGSDTFLFQVTDEARSTGVGITYGDGYETYVSYGGETPSEPEYELQYTSNMAKFVMDYLNSHFAIANNKMFDMVFPEHDNTAFMNAVRYFVNRKERERKNVIRVGTFNKFVSRGANNWPAIKQELADYSVDICGFQECGAVVSNNAVTSQIGTFLSGTQFTSYAEQDTSVKQALVSHWEVDSSEILTIMPGDSGNAKAVKAVINLYPYKWYSNFIDNKATLSVYVFHGASSNGTVDGVSKTSYELRMLQIENLLAEIMQDTSDFIVVVGDTNCFEAGLNTQNGTHAEWEAFRTAGFTPVLPGIESTVTADLAASHFFTAQDNKVYCDACYDQVFIGSNIRAESYGVVDSNLYPVEELGNVPVSDHCMVYADLIFDFDAVMQAKLAAALTT